MFSISAKEIVQAKPTYKRIKTNLSLISFVLSRFYLLRLTSYHESNKTRPKRTKAAKFKPFAYMGNFTKQTNNKKIAKMTFKKGEITNHKGRPKGSKNKRSEKLYEVVKNLLEDNIPQLKNDLRTLEPNERVKAITNLLAYAIPKQAAITAEAKIEAEFTQLEKLLQSAPEEAVQAIAAKVLTMQAEREKNENNEQ